MGMICDFFEAEQKGFVVGLGKYAKKLKKNRRQFWKGFKSGLETHFRVKEADFPIEKFYVFCTVHFARLTARVYRNHSVVPIQQKDEFKQNLSVLQDADSEQVCDSQYVTAIGTGWGLEWDQKRFLR